MLRRETDVFGQVLVAARARAGLTIEQVAEASGLPAEAIRQIEDGAGSELFNVLDRAVLACDSQMVVSVPRKLEMGEASQHRNELHDLIMDLLHVTDTREDVRWRAAMWGTPSYVMLGLLGAARELLRSVLLLDVHGHSYFPLPILVRQIWEYTATAGWIAQDPDERTLRVAQDTNYYVERRAKEDGKNEEYHRLIAMWDALGLPAEDFAKRLPSFADRLVGFFEHWYVRYRYFSLFTHPTMYVIDYTFERRETEAIMFRVDALGELPWLAFGALMVWGLANQLELSAEPGGGNSRSGLGFHCGIEDFVGLGGAIEDYTKPETAEEARASHGGEDVLT